MVSRPALPALRAAVYVRVSSDIQEREGTSLDTQEEACRRFAADHNYTVSEAHVYRETYSGAEFHDRPRLGDLRAALRDRQIDRVIAYAVDRLSRDQVHIWLILDEIDRGAARLEMVTESFDDSPTGKFLMSARAFAAEVERQKIRERTQRGRLAVARAGRLLGQGTDRYGYRRVPGESRREIHEPEAAVVRDIFESYGARQESLQSIIKRLNATEVQTPGRGKRKVGQRTYWGKGAVHRILTDPVYKGETYAFRWKGNKRGSSTYSVIRPREEWIALPEGTSPPIVSADLWDAVQARFASNTGDATRNKTRPYLLRGLLVCAVCGRKMYSGTEQGQVRTYRCSSRATPFGPCGGKRVPADDIEVEIWDGVATVLKDPKLIADQVEQARKRGVDQTLVKSLDAARRSLAKVEQGQERLLARFRTSDSIPWELVEREIARAESERKQILSTVAELEARIALRQHAAHQWANVEAYCQRVADRLDGFDFAQKRLALEALMIQITANGREWSLTGGVPTEDGVAGTLSLTSSRCGQNTRIIFSVSRDSLKRRRRRG